MCVALITDLEFCASYKGAWVKCNSSLTPRSNICLAKGGAVLSLQGIVGDPFSKVEKQHFGCSGKLSGVSLLLQAAAKT